MRKASWIMSVLVSTLLPLQAAADDTRVAVTVYDAADLYASSTGTHWRDSVSTTSWSLAQRFEKTLYPNDDSNPIATIDFRDPGALARVSKVRELCLLTLAEVGAARVFFGVNQRGLFGFHVGARPHLGDERSLEVARMPYLKARQRDRR